MTENDLLRRPKMTEDCKRYYTSLTEIQDCKHYLHMSLTEFTSENTGNIPKQSLYLERDWEQVRLNIQLNISWLLTQVQV